VAAPALFDVQVRLESADAYPDAAELVTNALRHSLPPRLSEAPGRIRLRLQHETSFILCGVLDTGSEAPRRREPDFIAETGRGLHIVESFSATWGWMPLDGGGKVVWALFQPVR